MRSFLIALLMLPLTAVAQVTLVSEAHKVVPVTQADGTVTEEWQTADKIVPGDKVGYRITYSNTGKNAAAGVVINNPVPANTLYLANSATGAGTQITYSVDGGESFAPSAELVVVDADGNERKARAEDITHIRWTLQEAIAQNASGSVEFQVRIQ